MLNETFFLWFSNTVFKLQWTYFCFFIFGSTLKAYFVPVPLGWWKAWSEQRTAHKESLCMHNFCRDQQPQKSPLYDWYKYGVEGGFEGKSREKTVAHMLSISHHITLMILATLLLPNYYSKSSFLALVTSKYISTIAILQKAISENFHHTLATTPFMKTSQSHHVKCSNNLRDENYNYSRGDTTRYI